jgi:hypothetical protein
MTRATVSIHFDGVGSIIGVPTDVDTLAVMIGTTVTIFGTRDNLVALGHAIALAAAEAGEGEQL